jgi:hypothetical protein
MMGWMERRSHAGDHFEGKTAAEHLKEARQKGSAATEEPHGLELPGFRFAACDAAKETSLLLLLLSVAFPSAPLLLFASIAGVLLLWKTGRSALVGWARLERLHRLIEEERWEIEHNRPQEREELTALYAAKGLKGKLLDDVISVLMADDSRLLQLMLEEEMGLTLEAQEHPLKQALGAALGVAISSLLFFTAQMLPFGAPWILWGTSLTVIGVAAWSAAAMQRNRRLEAVIWNLSLALFVIILLEFFVR